LRLSYEAIVNRALMHHPVWIVCGYDSREMPEALLEGGLETHQGVLTDQRERNAHYRMPETVVRTRTPPPAPLENLYALPIEAGGRGFRERVAAELAAAGVSESEAEDMVVAAGEVLSNAQRHGGEGVSVRVGRVDDRFVCEVSDDGPGIDDPLAGFLPPRPGHADGAGLWVARQLTQQVDIVPSPHRFSVRLWAGIGG
jgi:anti-sigma regulatory factor (Ser/Thr protein kinase)